MSTYLELYDYRLRVKKMYERRDDGLRAGEDAASVCDAFRREKDALFAAHPESPIDEGQRSEFESLDYFPYSGEFRVEASVTPVDSGMVRTFESDSEKFDLVPSATLAFRLQDVPAQLTLYWIEVYGGGLFLPFLDASAPEETYGGGRYLVDTIKGSTFPDGFELGKAVILDFNYAYNPSCAYNYRWVCPLAPHENRLPFPVRAGEKNFKL